MLAFSTILTLSIFLFYFQPYCEKLKRVISVVVQALINYVQYKIVLGAVQYTQKQHPTVTSLIIVSFKKHTYNRKRICTSIHILISIDNFSVKLINNLFHEFFQGQPGRSIHLNKYLVQYIDTQLFRRYISLSRQQQTK